jgi:antitoxin (DNA-binding transcriptional repressor) of toxin-antitoxin stability system
MGKKSEKSKGSGLKRISATEASRLFSEILDQVETGRRFLVQRHGRDVCVMAPPPLAGRRGSECLALLRGRTPVFLDDGFTKDLLDVLAKEGMEERPSWDS